MTIKVYYSDFANLPFLTEVLNKFPGMYKVKEHNKTHMVVSWPEATVGVGGTRVKNTALMNPYAQAERLAGGKGIVIC